MRWASQAWSFAWTWASLELVLILVRPTLEPAVDGVQGEGGEEGRAQVGQLRDQPVRRVDVVIHVVNREKCRRDGSSGDVGIHSRSCLPLKMNDGICFAFPMSCVPSNPILWPRASSSCWALVCGPGVGGECNGPCLPRGGGQQLMLKRPGVSISKCQIGASASHTQSYCERGLMSDGRVVG